MFWLIVISIAWHKRHIFDDQHFLFDLASAMINDNYLAGICRCG
jgi:hypothetical protein